MNDELPTNRPLRVMAVDDEELNLEILMKHLKKGGYEAVAAQDGDEAWEYLQGHDPDDIHIMLLDKMMPKMSGLELLQKIKSNPSLKHITVILQTASIGTQEMVEGIDAGAYYYLTKPYAAEVLMSVVNAAARDYRMNVYTLSDELQKKNLIVNITQASDFEIRTIEEAMTLTAYLANFFNDTPRNMTAISALLINAIEHGNLGIGYELKHELLTQGKWDDEVQHRLKLPENLEKKVEISFIKSMGRGYVRIRDQGAGFDWKQYIDFTPERITSPNGRGIPMAHITPHCYIEYFNNGCEVLYSNYLAGFGPSE